MVCMIVLTTVANDPAGQWNLKEQETLSFSSPALSSMCVYNVFEGHSPTVVLWEQSSSFCRFLPAITPI